MQTFKDATGRSWDIAIDVNAIKRVQGLVGVNLAEIIEPQRGHAAPLLSELQNDIVLLCDVIYALVKRQADEREISDEEFGRLLDGDTITAAHEAFWLELLGFFQKLPNRQAHVRAIEKQHAFVTAAIAAAEQQIQDFDVDQEVARVFGELSTSSPASSASTPAT